ncbi:hypothetical protein OG875_01430 [Streptomyces sp. NBC_01498]|uniref:hypothetical protein n=1 Tax=Streptomyces sp. NBC_01498 TaxID=2975870 RepID=UPI002E7BBD77|nr:hypothetical protein [Streptomyces sp. NBC_01498]WTL23376.1 hypothetical protein OG875_01430 [Streptomyces sp. NBC_01498]
MTEQRGGAPQHSATDETIAALAVRLRAADTGGWTADATRALIVRLGWGWSESPTVFTGRSTGDARLRPVGKYEERYVGGEAYVELAVPVRRAAPDAASQAEAFRVAKDELTATLGEASIMGVHGRLAPFLGAVQSWGSPYLRWRGERDTLELRAGPTGPELVLRPTDPAENWFVRQGNGEEHAISGFFGFRPDASNGGLTFPGGWKARSWETVTRALADFLTTLPAETSALRTPMWMPIYGRIEGKGAPILFDVDCGDRLMLACFAGEDVDASALGWGTSADHPKTGRPWPDTRHPRLRIDAGGPGEPSGQELAETIVATARAMGVVSPEDLLIGAEAGEVGAYRVTFYGLGLSMA